MRTEGEALQTSHTRAGYSKRGRRALIWAAIVAALVVALILVVPTASALAAPVTYEGSSPTGTTATGSSITFSHTSGTSANRLLLVGISWNCGSTPRTISSVAWNGTALTEVKTQLTDTTSDPRYSAVYKLVNPASGVTGNVVVTFSGGVTNGAIAGAANFANVDQTTPLASIVGAASANNSGTAVTVDVTGLLGTELVFDNVFMGVSSDTTTLTAGSGQTQRWFVRGYTSSATSFNTMAGASTEQATGSTVTMSWTASASAWWATVAMAIRPVGSAPPPPPPVTFSEAELLGQPTNNSMSVKVMPDAAVTLRCQYDTNSGEPYAGTSSNVAATAGTPATVTMSGLTANTKYYYRVQYSSDGGSTWTSRSEHSFWTQRAAGSTFTFDITTDSHINIQLGNTGNWTNTLNKVAADAPDFLIDLGDTFAMDNGSSSVALGDTAAAEQKYKDGLQYFNLVSANSPTFFTPGNHEQQEAWHLQGTLANSLPVMAKNAEKKFYLNPVPNSFYTGDTSTHPNLAGDQLKQDYYAWTWGDALFVVISPYWTTTTKPYTTSTGGGETDSTGSDNRWDWTLGQTQFNWLKTTLQNSNAKYKFVFSHQITGSNSESGQVNYGHGGVDAADFCEWGGYNVGTTTSGWATNRASWGSQPIRQMMKANGASAFFHGHDHQMAYEDYDDVVYQSVPSGSFSGNFGMYSTGGNSGNTIWADSTEGAGYLRVTVGPSQTHVEFIRYNGSSAAYDYNITPAASATYNLNLQIGWNLIAATPGATFPEPALRLERVFLCERDERHRLAGLLDQGHLCLVGDRDRCHRSPYGEPDHGLEPDR